MPIQKMTQIIDRPISEVFSTIIDVANFPLWNPTTPKARKLTPGETGEGTRFEMEIKGLGKVLQELREFRPNKQVRLVSDMKMVAGGHRFILTAQGNQTRTDHELEMTPKGVFKIFSPLIGMMGKKSLRDLASSLERYLERA
jgi:uncharacterized protein YndB with AHSA1/START domain